MKVRFQSLRPGAVLPQYGSAEAAALDIVLPTDMEALALRSGQTVVIPLGFKIEIPSGYVGKVKARSSMWSKGWRVSGFIDSDYRGEVKLMIQAPSSVGGGDIFSGLERHELTPGQKAAQLLIEPTYKIEPEWAEDLTVTARGEGGFGSTGV